MIRLAPPVFVLAVCASLTLLTGCGPIGIGVLASNQGGGGSTEQLTAPTINAPDHHNTRQFTASVTADPPDAELTVTITGPGHSETLYRGPAGQIAPFLTVRVPGDGTYFIVAVAERNGKRTKDSADVTVDTVPPTDPGTPTVQPISARPGRGAALRARWNPSTDTTSGIERYVVYRGGVAVGETTEAVLLSDIEGLEPCTEETDIAIQAVDRAGNESNRVRVTPLPVRVACGGTGSFVLGTSLSLGDAAAAVRIADLDEDSFADVIAAVPTEGIKIAWGNSGNRGGALSFNVRTISAPETDLVEIADLSHDGIPDLIVLKALPGRLQVHAGQGANGTPTRSFAAGADTPLGGAPRSASVGDFNRDGNLDVAVVTSASEVRVLLGNGNNTFRQAPTIDVGDDPRNMIAYDLDEDADLDLVVANRGGRYVSLLEGNGDGTFRERRVGLNGASPNSVAVQDYDADGNADLVVGTANEFLLLRQDAPLSFPFEKVVRQPGGSRAAGINSLDLNNDRIPDVVAVLGSDLVSVVTDGSNGKGTGSFAEQSKTQAGGTTAALHVGDLDDDYIDDVAVALGDGTLQLFLGVGRTMRPRAALGGQPFEQASRFANGTGLQARGLMNVDVDENAIGDFVTNNDTNKVVTVLQGQGFDGQGNGQLKILGSVAANAKPIAMNRGDFNADGKDDVIVSNHGLYNGTQTIENASITFLLGVDISPSDPEGFTPSAPTEDITFTPLTFGNGGPDLQALIGVASADFNRDGWIDAAVSASRDLSHPTNSGRILVLLGKDPSTVAANQPFLDVDESLLLPAMIPSPPGRTIGWSSPQTLNPTDVNRDGIVDLVVMLNTRENGQPGNAWLATALGKGDGTFRNATFLDLGAQSPSVLSSAATLPNGRSLPLDFDGNGTVDLLVMTNGAGQAEGRLLALLGDGAGRFTIGETVADDTGPGGVGYAGARAADLDRDGKLDVILGARDKRELRVYLGEGPAGGRAFSFADSPIRISVTDKVRQFHLRDINADTVFDIIVSGLNNQGASFFEVLLGDGVTSR